MNLAKLQEILSLIAAALACSGVAQALMPSIASSRALIKGRLTFLKLEIRDSKALWCSSQALCISSSVWSLAPSFFL